MTIFLALVLILLVGFGVGTPCTHGVLKSSVNAFAYLRLPFGRPPASRNALASCPSGERFDASSKRSSSPQRNEANYETACRLAVHWIPRMEQFSAKNVPDPK